LTKTRASKRELNSESEVLVVKTTKTLFIPQVATIVERVVFHGRAMKTKVGGEGNCDAHARFDVAKGGSVGMPPFFTEELSNLFEGVDCLGAEHAINGHNKRTKCCSNGARNISFGIFFFLASSEAIRHFCGSLLLQV